MVFLSREVDPFERMRRLQQELSRGVDPSTPQAAPRAGAFPPVNVFGGRDGYSVHAEVAGIAPESIALESHGQTLTISGSRDEEAEAGRSAHRRERWQGEFSRSIHLPEDADLESAKASARNGVLVVQVERHPHARPRQIPVETR